MITGITASAARRRITAVVDVFNASIVTEGGGFENFFPNVDLDVLFYQGESHGGGPPGNDLEWDIQAGGGTKDDSEGNPSTEPFPGYLGRFLLNAGPGFVIRGGVGPIPTNQGYFVHLIVADVTPGVTSSFAVYLTNREAVEGTYTLDESTKAAFNAWYDSLVPFNIEILEAGGATLANIVVTSKVVDLEVDNPEAANQLRSMNLLGGYWPQDDTSFGQKLRITPNYQAP